MRSLYCWLLLCFALGCLHALTGFGATPVVDIAWQQLEWDGIERVYGLYVPDGVAEPAALVVLLHGGGGSALKTWNQEHGRSWKALADEHGFVLLLPEGRADPGDETAHHWNDCRTDLDPSVISTEEDDVGFITYVIERVTAATSVDSSRVYVTGASNGGMMTYRLAIDAGDRFAAAAAVIANLPDPSECANDAAPIPMLIMNGTDDPLIPHEGGCVANDTCQRGRVMSTMDTLAFWIGTNHAAVEPEVEKLPNRAWFDGSTVTVYRFEGGEEGAAVVYYHIKGGGHNVPGLESDSLLTRALAGPKNRDINGPAEIWAFFAQH